MSHRVGPIPKYPASPELEEQRFVERCCQFTEMSHYLPIYQAEKHVGNVAVDLIPHYNEHTFKCLGVELTRISVSRGFRGVGYGRLALKTLCLRADCYSIPLFLTPISEEPGVFAQDALESWYRRYGFVPISDFHYRRDPQAPGWSPEERK